MAVGCAVLRGRDARRTLFLERGRHVDAYYAGHDHALHSSRAIPPEGLQHVDGRWRHATYSETGAASSAIVRFRGVNLRAKTPAVPATRRDAGHAQDLHASKADVSFVGRPFPLEEAPAHFRRLSHDWGFNLLRLSTSWEAAMHAGPGVLDAVYLDYLRDFVALAGEHGLYVLVDPHQDAGSRCAGGDGMPGWTRDAAGFDIGGPALHDAGSAALHHPWNASDGVPGMPWTQNYRKLASATMSTLFFAGDDYAPGITVGHAQEPIQTFLQRHYFQFIDAVAAAVKDCPNVLGFGTMNEPSHGFVGIDDISEIHTPLLHGHAMSAFDGMRLASGDSLAVPYYPSPFRHETHHTVNAERRTAYKTPELDIWQRVGVYETDARTGEKVLLRPHHFALGPDEDFAKKYMAPFSAAMRSAVTLHDPRLVTYAEPYFDPADPFGCAPHWYDAVTLFLGRYGRWLSFDFAWNLPVLGPALIDWTFRRHLQRLKHGEGRQADALHVVVGETGVPFTGRDGVTLALDRALRALESTDLDYALWCYETEHDEVRGEVWNGKDLSVPSRGKGRGVAAAVRPYTYQYSVGLTVEAQAFDPFAETYTLVLMDAVNDKDSLATVLLFVPASFREPQFAVSAGSATYDRAAQHLRWQRRGRSMGFYTLEISEKV